MIESLENNESILLMYLANELPPDDAAEVAQMLASDSALRAEYERLRSIHERISLGLRQLDEAASQWSVSGPGVRRVLRALRERSALQPTLVTLPQSQTQLRYPWWAYPSAAAAAILLAFLAWWGNHGGAPTHFEEAVPTLAQRWHLDSSRQRNHDAPSDGDVRLADELEKTLKANNDADSALLALRDDAPRFGELGGDGDE